MRRLLTLTSMLALAVPAAAVGPKYVPPVPPTAATGPFLSVSPALSLAPAEDQWWRLYADPVLDGLVEEALAHNTDVRSAVARLERARAMAREAGAGRLPQTNIAAGGTYGRSSAVQTLPGTDREAWRVDAGLGVSYEVDLFGRVGRTIQAARGDAGAAEADVAAVRISIAAETARAYADAASAAARLEVARRIFDLLDRSVTLTTKRLDAGLTTDLDTARITALRDQRRADIPQIEAERQAALFRLATLTGRTPAELPPIVAQRTTMLRLDQPIPVGDGGQLLSRRPDVRAAERRLAAATARIGVATADLYPRISLGGSIGSTGAGLSDLFGAGPLRWLLGPLISWNFPNQTVARARIAAAKADTQGALAGFDGAVLRALEETETALSNYGHALDRRTALQDARNQAERAVRITRAQAREGQIDSLAALDAERTFAETEAELALADARIADAQVDVFKALGGTWETRGAPSPTATGM